MVLPYKKNDQSFSIVIANSKFCKGSYITYVCHASNVSQGSLYLLLFYGTLAILALNSNVQTAEDQKSMTSLAIAVAPDCQISKCLLI